MSPKRKADAPPPKRSLKEEGDEEMIPYPRGLRLMAFVLIFLAASNLFRVTGFIINGAATGDRILLFGGVAATAYFVALLVVAIGLFWWKEWARFIGVGLMAIAALTALAIIVATPGGLNTVIGFLVVGASISVMMYLMRPHVKRYFAYMQ